MPEADAVLDAARLEPLLAALPPGLRVHCERTAEWAGELAQRFGADPEAARFAALAHDIARTLPDAELLARAQAFGIPMDEEQRATPLLLHGSIASAMLRRDLDVSDADVLDAVAGHMSGRAGMGLLEKVLFFADKTEPGRESYYEGYERALALAAQDLDQALLALLDGIIADYHRRSWPVLAGLKAAREWLAGVVAAGTSQAS